MTQNCLHIRRYTLKMTPNYRVESTRGPNHGPEFVVAVLIGPHFRELGKGKSKREAAQNAAANAYARIQKLSEEQILALMKAEK